eukprot:COSAG05_NODE_1332_length_5154_cov_7.919090_3_plen_72_part_00
MFPNLQCQKSGYQGPLPQDPSYCFSSASVSQKTPVAVGARECFRVVLERDVATQQNHACVAGLIIPKFRAL